MNKAIHTALIITLTFCGFTGFAMDNPAPETTKSAVINEQVVNINQADVKTLVKLKGIGKKKAKAIVEYREQHGQFSTVEELLKVQGIGKQVVTENIKRLTI